VKLCFIYNIINHSEYQLLTVSYDANHKEFIKIVGRFSHVSLSNGLICVAVHRATDRGMICVMATIISKKITKHKARQVDYFIFMCIIVCNIKQVRSQSKALCFALLAARWRYVPPMGLNRFDMLNNYCDGQMMIIHSIYVFAHFSMSASTQMKIDTDKSILISKNVILGIFYLTQKR